MGLLSSVGKAVFGDPTKGIKKATQMQIEAQKEAMKYLQGIDRIPLEYRDKAYQSVGDFFMGDPEVQQQFISGVQQNPFYNQMINTGEEAVLRNAAATGGFRSGTTSANLARNSQNVLQNLVGQQLQGQMGLMNPSLNTGNIANLMVGQGQTGAQGQMAMTNANQQLAGQTLSAILGAAGMAGNMGWQPFAAQTAGGANKPPAAGLVRGSGWGF